MSPSTFYVFQFKLKQFVQIHDHTFYLLLLSQINTFSALLCLILIQYHTFPFIIT